MKAPWKMALLLAGGLWGIVLALNWAGGGRVPIAVEQLRQLEREDRIESAVLRPRYLQLSLRAPTLLRVEGEYVRSAQVLVDRSLLTPEDERRWRRSPLLRPAPAGDSDWAGEAILAIFILLGAGFMVQQIRRDRRGDSPRRRIRALEEAHRRGEISPEEYRTRLEALWLEL